MCVKEAIRETNVMHILVDFLGLVLKIEDEEAPLYLTYAWSPTTIRPQPISDWVAVSNCAVQQLHIRCYQLTGGESVNDIQLLVAKLDSTSAVALILINNKDDYQIDSRFLPENEKWEFPILVVKPGSGGNFTEMIQSHGRKVTAKVEVSSIQILHARQTGLSCLTMSTLLLCLLLLYHFF